MSAPSLDAIDERSSRNASDIQDLESTVNQHGQDVARMDERLGNLERGQETAAEERARQGRVLDGIALKLKVVPPPHDHNHGSGGGSPPPAVTSVTAVAPAVGLGVTGWLKWISLGALGLLALAGATAEAIGLTNFTG